MNTSRRIDKAITVIFDNNRNEALDRQQLLEQVKVDTIVEVDQEAIRQSTIRLVDEEKIQPALFRGVLVYCSKDCEIENLYYKDSKILESQDCGCRSV